MHDQGAKCYIIYTADLVHDILPPRLQNASYQVQVEALECWSQGHNAPPPSAPTSHRQRAWDEPRVAAAADALLEAATDDRTRACLLASWNLVPGCRLSPCHPLASAWMMTPCEWQLDCGWEPHSANHTTASTVVTRWMSLHCMASAVEKVRAAIRAMQPSICCCRGL